MPVSVQLPGFQQREAPITGLAQVAGVVSNAYHNYQENKLVNAQQANEELKNQAAQLQIGQNQQLQQKLADPTSIETKTTKSLANTYAQGLAGTGLFNSKEGQSALKGLVDNVNDPNTSGLQIHQLFETSPLAKSISGLGEAQAKANGMAAGAQSRAQAFNVKNELQANQQYSSYFQPMDQTIQAANRVQHIIDRIKNGDLKSTPTLTTDLSNALGSMFNSGKAATVSGSEHAVAGLTSAEGDFASKYGYAAGSPMNTVAGPQLDQLGKDVGTLRDSYVAARQDAFDSWKQGIPTEFQGKLQKRFDSLSKTSAAPGRAAGAQAPAPSKKGPPVDADLTKMNPQQLQEYISTHGAQ